MPKAPPRRVPGRPLSSRPIPGQRNVKDDTKTSHLHRNKVVRVKTARGRSNSQARWLNRQLNDPYVKAAQTEGWRSRSAYKLMEMDDKFHVLKPKMTIIDLGAAPGGWCQVAAKRSPQSTIIAIDLLPIDELENITTIEGDFMVPAMTQQLQEEMKDHLADLVMSDMAPNTTGHAGTDHIRIMSLAENALHFAIHMTNKGGTFIAKLFQGGAEKKMLNQLKKYYTKVRHVKPPASRKESSELYVIATGFKGL